MKKQKNQLHPRNIHQGRYDLDQLVSACPPLGAHVFVNPYDNQSIDFADPTAVKLLNKALLIRHYGIKYWDVPPGYLCPPIPGRADYIHHIADCLASKNQDKIPKGKDIKCLDIGTGANCIYSILGNRSYGWSFVGTEIDQKALDNAQKIIANNSVLKNQIELRFQPDKRYFFRNIVKQGERFELSICNPPFHASAEASLAATRRKVRNLSKDRNAELTKNFSGKNNELWCEGGELQFISNMIRESKKYADSIRYFSSMVSKESNLVKLYKILKKVSAKEVKTINMGQGNKTSRIIVWTF